LRRARLAAGFSSQDSLAAKLGFDRTVIAKAETGDRPPTTEVLAAWCATCQLEETIDQCWRKSSYSGNGERTVSRSLAALASCWCRTRKTTPAPCCGSLQPHGAGSPAR